MRRYQNFSNLNFYIFFIFKISCAMTDPTRPILAKEHSVSVVKSPSVKEQISLSPSVKEKFHRQNPDSPDGFRSS